MLSGSALKKCFLKFCMLDVVSKILLMLEKVPKKLESSQNVFVCGIVMNSLKFVEECVG